MIQNILLISEKILKSVTLINDNIDGGLLQPALVASQEINLQNIIGTKLLNRLKELVRDGKIEEEEDYKLLLDEYIVPFLCWDTLSEIQIPLNYKFVNLGIVKNSDTNNATVELKDLQYLIDYYKKKSDFFSKRLTDFLCSTNKYPEYRNNSYGDVRSKDSEYCGIYLGNNYNSGNYWYK